MKLGSWLIARGKISGVQLKRALLDQSFYGGHLSTSLMKLGYLDENTLGEYLSDSFKVPYATPSRFENIPQEVLRMIPRQLAEKHVIVPLGVGGKNLHLAMMDPRDILVLDEVAFLTGSQVEPFVSSEKLILDALERYYQIPRPVRETIPLADRVEELIGSVDHESFLPPPRSEDYRSGRPATGPEEVGLDGRPLSASAEIVSEYDSAAARTSDPAAASAPPPRNILEWREQEDPARGPSVEPAAVVAATMSVETPGPVPAPPAPLPAGTEEKTGRAASVGRPPLTLVPPHPSASLEEVSQRLRESGDRDEVFDAVLEFGTQRFLRTALFVVLQDKVIGWSGRGEGFDPVRVRSTTVPFTAPSIFSYFRVGSDFYFGPAPDLPANRQFNRDLSVPPPDRVLLVPILIKGRLIAIFYGDHGTRRREEPDIALFRRLAQKASLALEILILRNKISMV